MLFLRPILEVCYKPDKQWCRHDGGMESFSSRPNWFGHSANPLRLKCLEAVLLFLFESLGCCVKLNCDRWEEMIGKVCEWKAWVFIPEAAKNAVEWINCKHCEAVGFMNGSSTIFHSFIFEKVFDSNRFNCWLVFDFNSNCYTLIVLS